MSNDFTPIQVRDLAELEMVRAEVQRRLLPWLVQAVVRVIIEAGVPLRDVEPLALETVQRAHPMLTAALRAHTEAIAAQMRADGIEAAAAQSGSMH